MRNIAVAALGVSIACAIGAASSFGGNTGSQESNSLAFTLKDMAIAGKQSVGSGRVTLSVTNAGTVEHELVVMRGGSPLKVKAYKAVEAGRWLGEVEELGPGKHGKVTIDLKPGTYLLICNVVGHYQLGMKTVLHVT